MDAVLLDDARAHEGGEDDEGHRGQGGEPQLQGINVFFAKAAHHRQEQQGEDIVHNRRAQNDARLAGADGADIAQHSGRNPHAGGYHGRGHERRLDLEVFGVGGIGRPDQGEAEDEGEDDPQHAHQGGPAPHIQEVTQARLQAYEEEEDDDPQQGEDVQDNCQRLLRRLFAALPFEQVDEGAVGRAHQAQRVRTDENSHQHLAHKGRLTRPQEQFARHLGRGEQDKQVDEDAASLFHARWPQS